MAQVGLIDPASSAAAVKPTLDKINGAFCVVPNMSKAVTNSPAAVANANSCEYCLAAHTALGRKACASSDEMAAAQVGESSDPRTQAAPTFALKVVRDRAAVTDADVAALKTAGFDDEGVVEIIANVALNLFTNYVNVALNVPGDFPAVQLKRVA